MVAIQRSLGGGGRFVRTTVGLAMLTCLISSPVTLFGQAKYQNSRDAYNVGVAFAAAQKFADAREPLEIALQLAQDDATRLRVSEPLIVVYRKLAVVPQFIERAEFVIEKTDQDAKRSLTRSALIGFVREQGVGDDFVKRHEEILKKAPENRTSLYILSEAYDKMKRDPKRAGELTERLLQLDKKSGKPQDVRGTAELAGQHAKAGKLKEAAELYEQIAPLDAKLAAWHYKEAATAWMKANEKSKALEAARKSAASAPETRSELLEYFWQKALADVFLNTGDPVAAIKHYEAAIQKTKIEGYRKDCEKLLAEAKQKANAKATF